MATNKNIKVGDIFSMSWGYDQTNVDFFRVKAKRGKTQLIVQEVHLKLTDSEYYCDMGGEFKYDPKNWQLVERSIFIDDNEKGKIVNVKNWNNGEHYFVVYNHHACTPYKGQKITETWYA